MKLTSFLIGATLVASTTVSTGPRARVRPRRPGSGILLRLHDQAARVTTLTVQAGGHASITGPGLPTLRFAPTVRPDGLLDIAVSIVSGADVSTSEVRPTAAMTLGLGGTSHVEQAGYALEVEWADAWESVAAPALAGSQAECCVVCGGVKTCACRVQAPCGSCCDEACGGCRTPSSGGAVAGPSAHP